MAANANEMVRQLAVAVIEMVTGVRQVAEGDLITLLRFVGYEGVTAVQAGVITTPERDEGGDPTGRELPANTISNLVVYDGESINRSATFWLNSLWGTSGPNRMVAWRSGEINQTWVDEVSASIERSIQLRPIVVSELGERLLELRDGIHGDSVYGVHSNDITKLHTCVHDICGGVMGVKPVSLTHQVLICRGCSLRVILPTTIKTYGDLRQYFAHLQPQTKTA